MIRSTILHCAFIHSFIQLMFTESLLLTDHSGGSFFGGGVGGVCVGASRRNPCVHAAAECLTHVVVRNLKRKLISDFNLSFQHPLCQLKLPFPKVAQWLPSPLTPVPRNSLPDTVSFPVSHPRSHLHPES